MLLLKTVTVTDYAPGLRSEERFFEADVAQVAELNLTFEVP